VLRLVWREGARAEAAAIVRYVAERNPAAADKLEAAIHACAERLPEHPFLYRPGRVPGTREAVVHPNYILVYRVAGNAVEVVSVVHARRQYP
jgi:toxin ParE1/3/4